MPDDVSWIFGNVPHHTVRPDYSAKLHDRPLPKAAALKVWMKIMDFSIRKMKIEDVHTALKWAEVEGWNPGLHDAECFFRADPGGFLLGEIGGEPVGCISTVNYGDSFGFLGLYIVRPEFRGNGYGLRLWNEGMKHLGSRNTGLDGVVAHQKDYMKSGFCLAYRNLRYQGTTLGKAFDEITSGEATGIVDLSSLPFEQIAAYDKDLFPAPREEFLRCWLDQPEGKGLGITTKDHTLAGYGYIRRCRTGFKVGPLFADSPDLADVLLAALCKNTAGEPVFLDIPEPNASALALVRRHGMEQMFETARMYTKGEPGLPLDRVFGVTTFELG